MPAEHWAASCLPRCYISLSFNNTSRNWGHSSFQLWMWNSFLFLLHTQLQLLNNLFTCGSFTFFSLLMLLSKLYWDRRYKKTKFISLSSECLIFVLDSTKHSILNFEGVFCCHGHTFAHLIPRWIHHLSVTLGLSLLTRVFLYRCWCRCRWSRITWCLSDWSWDSRPLPGSPSASRPSKYSLTWSRSV